MRRLPRDGRRRDAVHLRRRSGVRRPPGPLGHGCFAAANLFDRGEAVARSLHGEAEMRMSNESVADRSGRRAFRCRSRTHGCGPRFRRGALGLFAGAGDERGRALPDLQEAEVHRRLPGQRRHSGIHPPDRKGEFAAAARKIKQTNALPAVCGRVCPQEAQCEKQCVLGKKSEPVADRTAGAVRGRLRARERPDRAARSSSRPTGARWP